MTAAGLLLVALLCNYLPEVIVAVHGGSLAAWFFVADNLQTAALWWAVGSMAETLAQYEAERARVFLLPTLAVCAYGIFEAIQAPICRLAFPMNVPPPKHPEGVCGAAGLPTYDLSPLLIALCAVILARTLQPITDARTHQA